MGFKSSRRTKHSSDTETKSTTNRVAQRTTDESTSSTSGLSPNATLEEAKAHFGMQVPDKDTMVRLQRLEAMNTTERVRGWVDEGMTVEDMGNPLTIEAFRERQAERPPEVPTNIERQNRRSVLRSEKAASEAGSAGDTGVPEPVRDVISSTGQSLDPAIQRAMENRMDDSFSDVQIHTGSQAAAACEAINARAFTVGNHIAFNSGEYDPSSAEGQHVLAHELAHVRQQTGGAVSMLPQEDVDLEVDPDPVLEQEAEETAQRVMQGGELGIQRLADTEVHIQRAGLGSHINQDRTWSPGSGPDQPKQPDGQPVEINVDEIAADPEKLAEEVQQIKANQQLVMETLTEAKPGATTSPSMDDIVETAAKGAGGSLASAGAGAAIGTMMGGPVGTAVGAGVGAVAGMASDLTKLGVDYAADRVTGDAQQLEQMYSEMTKMYKEMKEGKDSAVGRSQADELGR